MSSKTVNKNHSLYSRSSLLTILFFVILYFLIAEMYFVFNATKTANYSLPYDEEDNCYIFDENIDRYTTVYLDDHLTFFPNIQYDTVRVNHFDRRNYSAYPRAENVSISSTLGWNDVGPNAKWYFSSEKPYFIEYKDDDGNSYYAGAYLVKIKGPEEVRTLNISVPKCLGTVDVFCNGTHLKRVTRTAFDNIFTTYEDSFESIQIETNSLGEAIIIYTVASATDIYNPGLLSIPTLNNHHYNIARVISITIYTTIIAFTIIVSIVGGITISRTFSHKGKLYSLILSEFVVMVYYLLDNNLFYLPSPLLDDIKYSLVTILAIITYYSIGTFFKSSNETTNILYKIDYLIVAVIGIILNLVLSLNPQLLMTPYPYLSSIIYATTLTVVTLLKVATKYHAAKNSTIVFNIYITLLFSFIFIDAPINIVVDIKPYIVFLTTGLLSLIFYFVLSYVAQYYEIRNTSDKLQYLVKEKTLHISEINRDLYNTNKRLLENEEARKNVLSNVSHDLRTPITAIRGYAELLITAGRNMKEEQKELYLNNIIKRSVQMERIVSDIVELTKMESNKDEFKFNDISISELLEETYKIYLSEVENTTKTISLDIPEDDLLIVKADYKKISRVFENLISNSINYTNDDGKIAIKAWREGKELGLNEQRVHITIEDNGIGIPQEEISNIFDRFYRAKNSGKNIKGTGLGLSIVKTIIKNHDADITVQSELNAGTTFHIVMKATYY